jgi:hypothetical protein
MKVFCMADACLLDLSLPSALADNNNKFNKDAFLMHHC